MTPVTVDSYMLGVRSLRPGGFQTDGYGRWVSAMSDESGKLDSCYETYTMMPDRRALLVRFVDGRYVALLVDRELNVISKLLLVGNCDISEATRKALLEFGINGSVATLLLKESVVERDDDGSIEVSEELLDSLRSVSTESIRSLIGDDCIDRGTKAAMSRVLRERLENGEDH